MGSAALAMESTTVLMAQAAERKRTRAELMGGVLEFTAAHAGYEGARDRFSWDCCPHPSAADTRVRSSRPGALRLRIPRRRSSGRRSHRHWERSTDSPLHWR